jgi:branched-chain amino acid transport system substrate-binding protein
MDDDLLNGMGDAAPGTVTAHIYSAAPSVANEQGFRRRYKKARADRGHERSSCRVGSR